MACFHPLSAWQQDSGAIVFAEVGSIRRALTLPCGRCIGCRLVRVRSWAIRCVHESQMHESSEFVTLTYDNDHYFPSLRYKPDFQLFMKRLRRRFGPTRFFACGEYGEEGSRPHFHALLFGLRLPDRRHISNGLYRSAALDELWRLGDTKTGSVSFQSAAYVARYAVDKVTGDMAKDHYERVDLKTGELFDVLPEMGRMSLKPGIGYPWFVKYWRDVYAARDGVVVDGRTLPPPRFYDRLLERTAPELRSDKEADRYFSSLQFQSDCTPERLAVREVVAKARLLQSVRTL